MTERPRRPILHLKLSPERLLTPAPAAPARSRLVERTFTPARSLAPTPAPVTKPLVEAGARWKCKPCGATIAQADMIQEGHVRCPGCNARLGLAADFHADPPRTERLRARLVRKA